MTELEEGKFVEEHRMDFWREDNSVPLMKMYVGAHYPSDICNLKCPYCYIGQKGIERKINPFNHTPEFVRWCLSQKRLGGRALVGLCGSGETLLGDKIIEVALALLEEGHFLHIVTNGTLGDRMCEMVKRAGKRGKHIFFKCSLHYTELKKRGLLGGYADGIHRMSEMGGSYTVELTADDGYIPVIDEIMEYCLKEFGALPHVTIARDDTKKEIPILTSLTMDEYYKIWSEFNSELFNIKWKYYAKPIMQCKAGEKSIYVDLTDGRIERCLFPPVVGNIYDTTKEYIRYEPVEDGCELPYCFNNHAYLALGITETVQTYSFAEVRDRKTVDGNHWVKEEVYKFMNQKLYEN